ncbi:uncharacterized protein LOC143145986 isoform X2 [Ptiloglossa arizonensis]
MKKLFLILCIAFVAASLVEGCKPPGSLCSSNSDCCVPSVCNPWAGRCTSKPIQGPPANPSKEPAAPLANDQL